MATGHMCGACSFLKVYWEEDMDSAVLRQQIADGEPYSCQICGTGELKLVNGINPAQWCDDCCKHKSKCKCERLNQAAEGGTFGKY